MSPTTRFLHSVSVVSLMATLLTPTFGQQPKLAYPGPQYCAVDPVTKIPYEKTISFEANKYGNGVAEGGDANTPGVQWIWHWTAPGPVYSVDGSYISNGWMQIDYCAPDGNNAICQGWVNSAGRYVKAVVRWKQKCQHEQYLKELGPLRKKK